MDAWAAKRGQTNVFDHESAGQSEQARCESHPNQNPGAKAIQARPKPCGSDSGEEEDSASDSASDDGAVAPATNRIHDVTAAALSEGS